MRKIIMAVDDEKHVLASLKRIFRGNEYLFFPFQSSVDALNALIDLKPHVIISDKRMPHIEGVDFLTRASRLCHCSLRILLTGYRNNKRDMKSPVDRVISKPWNNEQIEREISQTRILPNRIAIPLAAQKAPMECILCGMPHAHWEIRLTDYSYYACAGCYEKMAPYNDSFSESIMMNHMLGNVI